jgi:hypothetical protein
MINPINPMNPINLINRQVTWFTDAFVHCYIDAAGQTRAYGKDGVGGEYLLPSDRCGGGWGLRVTLKPLHC